MDYRQSYNWEVFINTHFLKKLLPDLYLLSWVLSESEKNLGGENKKAPKILVLSACFYPQLVGKLDQSVDHYRRFSFLSI